MGGALSSIRPKAQSRRHENRSARYSSAGKNQDKRKKAHTTLSREEKGLFRSALQLFWYPDALISVLQACFLPDHPSINASGCQLR